MRPKWTTFSLAVKLFYLLKEVHHERYRCRALIGAGDGNINPAGSPVFKLFRSRVFDRRGRFGLDAP